MRPWVFVFASLLGCAEAVVPDDVVETPPSPDVGPEMVPSPFVPARAPMYFKAFAATPFLRSHSSVFERRLPRRLSPIRGAGYGLGAGRARLLDLDPPKRLAVVHFAPFDANGAGGLFTVNTSGVDAEHPVPIAKDVDVVDRFAIDEAWVAYVGSRGIEAVRLDGSDASEPQVVLPLSGADFVVGLEVRNGILAAEILFRRTPTSHVVRASLEDRVSLLFAKAYALEHLLVDGRVLVRDETGLVIVDEHGEREWFKDDGHAVASSETHIVMSSNSGGTRLDVYALEPPFESVQSLGPLAVNQFEVPADGRSVFASGLDRSRNGLFQLMLDGSQLPDGGYLGEGLSLTSGIFAVARDGRFAVVCSNAGIASYGAGREPKVIASTCPYGTLVGLVADDRVAVFTGNGSATFVDLETSATDQRLNVGAFAKPARDGLIDLFEHETEGEEAVYRVDAPGRWTQILSWERGSRHIYHPIGDWFVSRRGSVVRTVDVRGLRREATVATVPSEGDVVGITEDHLVVVDRTNWVSRRSESFRSHPVDGSSATEPHLDVEIDGLLGHTTAGGHIIGLRTNQVVAARVDGADAAPRIVFESEYPIDAYAYDEARERLFVVTESPDGPSISAVALDGSDVRTSALRSSLIGSVRRIGILGRRALIMVVRHPSIRTYGAIDLDDPTTVVAIPSVPQSEPVLFADGEYALVRTPTGTSVVALEDGASVVVAGAPLAIHGPDHVSPSQAWFFGYSPSGQLVVAPTDASVDPRIFAESAVDAAFTPDDRVLFLTSLEADGLVDLYIRRPGRDERATRISEEGFDVKEIISADEDGVYVRSTIGGDSSVFYLPYVGGAAIAATPVDDAEEVLITQD